MPMKKMLKKFLLTAFMLAAPVAGGTALLRHNDAAAREMVARQGYDVTHSETGILVYNHGGSVFSSGTFFVAQDKNGNNATGVVHNPLIGKASINYQVIKPGK